MQLVDVKIYPVKSTRRISQLAADVEPWGLRGDRRWMVVDEAGKFCTQRTFPRLALVQAVPTHRGLLLTAPGMAPVYARHSGHSMPVTVWKDHLNAEMAQDGAHTWLEAYLRRKCYLVFMPDPEARPANPMYAGPGASVTFADGFPLLLTAEASLQALNDRMAHPVPMERFRPNVVVAGSRAFEEDYWERIRIGSVVFQVVKPCTRCVITTTDQDTATREKEPLRTLSTFRKHGNNVFFGENLVPESRGTIRVGDPVEVLRRGKTANFP